MKKSTRKSLVDDFSKIRPSYVAFADRLKELITSLLDANDVKIQIVESRAKEVPSLEEKLARPGKNYGGNLSDVPDLTGCRIILYYVDDIPKVSSIIEKEFEVVEMEASHQPEAFDADRFGYLSMHYVIKIGKSRARLTEWRIFSEFRAEIQIRTVIQHAWSAVSHALQYKRETSVPSKLSRRLFRIAGLFELADEEFAAIRDQKKQLESSAAEALARGDKDIQITPTAVEQFISQWSEKQEFIEAAESAGFQVLREIDPDDPYIGHISEFANRVQLKSINDLKVAIEKVDKKIFGLLIDARESESWTTNEDFLVYILLVAAFKENVELANQGEAWHEDVFSQLKMGLSRL